MPDTAAALLKRESQLITLRGNAPNTWQRIADFTLPHKSNIVTQREEGARQTDRLFDSTAPHALVLLAATLSSTMTPNTQPWLTFKMRDEELNEDADVQKWLEDSARRLHRAYRQSTFYQSIHEMYLDLCAFGIGALLIEEKPPLANGGFAGFRFQVPAAGTYCVAEDADGFIDTLFRRFPLSLRACYAKWGDKIGSELVQKMNEKPDTQMQILHAVYPRTDRAYGPNAKPRAGRSNMPYASCYVIVEQKVKVEEGGYEEFPYIVPRWTKSSGEVYGRGPSHTALPDIASLNAAKEFILKAAPLAMQPPTLERDDAVVGDIDLTPAGRNVVNGGGPLAEQIAFMDTKNRIDMSQLVLAELRQGIHAIYFTDQLILQQKPDMTATEVLALQEQTQRLLGPTTGRFESEGLNPLALRSFALMARGKALQPVPAVLAEIVRLQGTAADMDIEYEGPLARAQRSLELAAQDRVVLFVGNVAQQRAAIDPKGASEMYDTLDWDKMIRSRAEITGLPVDQVRSQQDVQGIRGAREEEQAQLAEAENAKRMSEMGRNVAPLVKAVGDQGGAKAA